ncbi:MAG: Rne/Rng family ribonuclease [Planctomycetota bacterium]
MPAREMLINYVPGEESRIAIVEDGKLEEFYHERAANVSHVNNIYQGVVTNVEPAIQAAFVDFGLEQNGFLHVTDVHPRYFPGNDDDQTEKIGSKTRRRERPPIEKCFKRGSKVLVQVIKEGVGTKGPTVTSYCSIPGRFLVMMPDMERHGVSRKTEDEDARKEMRDILKTLDPPDGFGFIVRTAGLGQTKTDLKRDLAYLVRLWKDIDRKRKGLKKKTGELYTESDLVIRTLRDVFTPDIEKVIVDDPAAAQRAHEFLAVANPRTKSKVVLYQDPVPLFHRFGIEAQIETIGAREVPLPSGGALVIDPTEALVAIDVNSGKSRKARDAESNAYQTNQEAVDEIARQLRLRDLGGLVVLDLIDMMQAKHRKSIENRLKNLLKEDRARTRVGHISQFGMLEMTRQRMRPSLEKAVYQPCGHCNGAGFVKSAESVVFQVMRGLALAMQREGSARIELTISPDVAFQILNRKRAELVRLETLHAKPVTVRVGGGRLDYVQIAAFNAANVELADLSDPKQAIPKPTETTFREMSRDDLVHYLEELDALEAAEDPAEVAEKLSSVSALHAEAGAPQASQEDDAEGGKKRRRRRGGRRRRKGEPAETAEREEAADQAEPAGRAAEGKNDDPEAPPATRDEAGGPEDAEGEDGTGKKKRRRRRRRRGRSRGEDENPAEAEAQSDPDTEEAPASAAASPKEPGERPPGSPPRTIEELRQMKGKRDSDAEAQPADQDETGEAAGKTEAIESETAPDATPPADEEPAPAKTAKKKRTRKKTTRKKKAPAKTKTDADPPPDAEGETGQAAATDDTEDTAEAPKKKRRRRRKKSAAASDNPESDAPAEPASEPSAGYSNTVIEADA